MNAHEPQDHKWCEHCDESIEKQTVYDGLHDACATQVGLIPEDEHEQ